MELAYMITGSVITLISFFLGALLGLAASKNK